MLNDNRMGWIRNLETLAVGGQQYTVEYELGSECQIPGLLDYGDGHLICASMSTEESRLGLWLYNLVIRYPLGPYDYVRPNKDGYYFKDGILGELVALLSLVFRCRFYLISSRTLPSSPSSGMIIKREYPFIRVKCDPVIHPPLFHQVSGNLATDFKDFLDIVVTLEPTLHQRFILAAHHYARAIREVGVDSEMVFIRLVSAIEALLKDEKLDSKDDSLDETAITALIDKAQLPTEALRNELKSVFDVRKAKKKFIRFVERNSTGYFKGGNSKTKQLRIRRSDLGKVLGSIYDARSGYLHSGEPMFLSRPIKGGEKWDREPVSDMIIDNRLLKEKTKLPYAPFFEGLVRHCLINYLNTNSSSRGKHQ